MERSRCSLIVEAWTPPEGDCPCDDMLKTSGGIPRPVFGSHPDGSSMVNTPCADVEFNGGDMDASGVRHLTMSAVETDQPMDFQL